MCNTLKEQLAVIYLYPFSQSGLGFLLSLPFICLVMGTNSFVWFQVKKLK